MTWETTGFRVRWFQQPAFASQPPETHEQIVETTGDVLDLLRTITRRQPCTDRATYGPTVHEIQRRVETREVPVGLSWERAR